MIHYSYIKSIIIEVRMIEQSQFGKGEALHFFLSNANGMKVGLTNFGARIVEVLLPVEEDGGVRNVRLSA